MSFELVSVLFLYLIPAFFMGLFSAAHCFGMCGGISAALSFSTTGQAGRAQLPMVLAYNFGRLSSYTLMGLFAGLLSAALSARLTFFSQTPVLRLLAASMMIITGFYLSGWWKILTKLEKLGAFFWRRLQPLSKKMFPVSSPAKALALGALWGWLPCGLVYSALAFSLSSAAPLTAGLSMLSFGLGTLPALLLMGLGASRLKGILQQGSVRVLSGLAFIVFGLWTLYAVGSHALKGHGHHAQPADEMHQPMDHHH